MKKTFADPWVQLLVYTTLLSGALTALLVFAPRRTALDPAAVAAAAPAPAAAPSAAAVLASPAAAPVLSASPTITPLTATGSQSLVMGPYGSPPPSALGISPGLGPPAAGAQPSSGGGITMTPSGGTRPGFSLQGAGIIKVLTAKTPGRWIVDGSGAADADTGDINEALYNAKDGDEILLRPGVYKAEIATAKKKLGLTGTGADLSKTVIENSDHNLIEVSGGELSLKNMTLRRRAGDYGELIGATDAVVSLTDVRMEAAGNGEAVSLKESTLRAVGVQFHGGRTAVDVREHSKAYLERCTLEEHKTSLLVDGGKSFLELKSTTVDGGEMGIYATKGAGVKITGGKFTGQEQSSVNLTTPGSTAEIVDAEFSGSKDGLWIYENATMTVRNSRFKNIRGEGIFTGEASKTTATDCQFDDSKTAMRVATRATLEVVGGAIVGSNRYGVEADDSAKMTLTGTTFKDNGGVAVYIQRQAEGTLRGVKILKTSDIGLFVGENSSATLEKTTVDGSLKAGVSLGRDARFKAAASAITGNGRCGLSLSGESATVTLRDVVIHRNECAISFVEGGAVDSQRGDFLGNKKGAFMFAEVNKSKIALTGAGNKTK